MTQIWAQWAGDNDVLRVCTEPEPGLRTVSAPISLGFSSQHPDPG